MNLLIDIVLLCAALVLIWPQPIRTTLRRAAPVLLLLVLAGVAVFAVHERGDRTITVTALDERGPNAEGTEIWIKSVIADGVEYAPDEVFSQGWLSEDGYLKWRAYDQTEGMTDAVTAQFPKGTDVDILFQTNRWRGVAQVQEGSCVSLLYRLDCYADSEGEEGVLRYQEAKTPSGVRMSGKVLFVGIFALLLLLASVYVLLSKRKDLRGPGNSIREPAAEREFWLDGLKALAAPLIVLIHTVGNGYSNTPVESGKWFGYLILNAIPRCAVPLFVMISGILLIGRETTMEKVWRNVKKALALLVVWNVFYVLLQAMLWGPQESIWRQIVSLPVKRGPSGHLWYAYFLVWLYLFSPVISALYKVLSEKMRLYFVLLTVIVPGVLDLYLKAFDLSGSSALYAFQLYMTLNYIGIMFTGRLIYERAIHMSKPIAVYACAAAAGLGGMIAVTSVYCRSHGSATDMFMPETQLLSVCYAAGVLGLAAEYRDVFRQLPGRVRRAVEWLARHAIGIYFIHVFNTWTLGSIWLGGLSLSAENNAFQAMLMCGLYYVLSVIEIALMERVPLLRKLIS